MSSFKQFGGLAYNSKHNITGATHSIHTDQIVTGVEGAPNTRSIVSSHIDLTGSSLLQVGNIIFADGTSLNSASDIHYEPYDPSWDAVTGPPGNDGMDGAPGPAGPAGPAGPTGQQGAAGDQGPAGEPGKDGQDGQDGKDGKDGKDGQDGQDGATASTDAQGNTAIGTNVLQQISQNSTFNTGVGGFSLSHVTLGTANTAIGYTSLNSSSTGGHNTAVGYWAGNDCTTGSRNTYIGASSGAGGNTGLTNTTAIGAGAQAEQSNTIMLGDHLVTNVITHGTLTGLAKNFTIDHPLHHMKQQGRTLKHASVEAPRLDLIYRDTIRLENGQAHINIDTMFHMTEGTFEKLCNNPSVFVTNESDWDPVRGTIDSEQPNILHILCKNQTSDAKVSFLVIAERKDNGVINSDMTDINGRFIPEPHIKEN